MISEEELALLASDLEEDALPDVVTIYHRTVDPWGSTTETVTVTKGRLSPHTVLAREGEVAERITSTTIWNLVIPRNVTVSVPDEILVKGGRFEVVGVLSPRSFQLATRLQLKRLS
jgi:hypothetical protein